MKLHTMKLRALLFAPGDQPRKIEKALASEADGVILDLEDAVAPPNKVTARADLARLLRGRSRTEVIVRVNPRDTGWYLDDLAAIIPARPAAVMLPKCGGPDDLVALGHHLEALEAASGQVIGTIKVIALVAETAAGVAALPDYRMVPERVIAFCFGAEDLAGDIGAAPRRADGGYIAPVAAARAATLLAAAACGVAALDTPFTDPRDPEGLAREAAAAATDGFVGKLLIHPAQIAPVRAAFTPSAERAGWARAVLAAFAETPALGVATLHGKMIEVPHVRLARRILDAAG
jgi:citrate lyase subunit beta/citryl-CoA lyase